MAGGKASPRQKMINMMYLVLTALLALNVSAEILKSFYLVEQSMDATGKNLDEKQALVMKAFKNSAEKQGGIADSLYKVALNVEKEVNGFVKYVEDLKTELTADGREAEGENAGQLKERSNMEKHANILINQKKGEELRNKINATNTKLLSFLNEKDRASIKSLLVATNKDANHTWESELFEHSPLAAVVTLLTKIENDAKTVGSDIIGKLYEGITVDLKTVNTLEAKLFPKSDFVMSGEAFTADVLLSAYDNTQSFKVTINGKEYTSEAGKVAFTEPTSGNGIRKIKGEIEVQGRNGVEKYPFEKEYTVFTGAASVSAEALNVFYIGLSNPITISVPGFSPDVVKASMTGGTLIPKGGNKYEVKVTQRGKATISVSVVQDGKSKNMGGFDFKVLPIPKPEARWGTLEAGAYSSGSVKAQGMVNASLGSFVYEGVKYTVTEYSFVKVPRRGEAQFAKNTGAIASPQIKSYVNSIKSGDKLIFSDIVATGPDGKRKLSPLVIDVQ